MFFLLDEVRNFYRPQYYFPPHCVHLKMTMLLIMTPNILNEKVLLEYKIVSYTHSIKAAADEV